MSLETQFRIRNQSERIKGSLTDLHAWIDDINSGKSDQNPKSLDEALAKKTDGNVRFAGGDFESAIKEYSAGIALLPAGGSASKTLMAQLLLNRSLCYYNLRKFIECIHDSKQSYKLNPTSKALFRRGCAELELEWLDAARRSFNKFEAMILPSDIDARQLLHSKLESLSTLEENRCRMEADECRRRLCHEPPEWCKNLPREPLIDLNVPGICFLDSEHTPVKTAKEIIDKPRYIPRAERMYPSKSKLT